MAEEDETDEPAEKTSIHRAGETAERLQDWDEEWERSLADPDIDDGEIDSLELFGDAEPDPGYMAFARELEDPLADWPSPDAKLEDLPELNAGRPLGSDTGNDVTLADEDRPADLALSRDDEADDPPAGDDGSYPDDEEDDSGAPGSAFAADSDDAFEEQEWLPEDRDDELRVSSAADGADGDTEKPDESPTGDDTGAEDWLPEDIDSEQPDTDEARPTISTSDEGPPGPSAQADPEPDPDLEREPELPLQAGDLLDRDEGELVDEFLADLDEPVKAATPTGKPTQPGPAVGAVAADSIGGEESWTPIPDAVAPIDRDLTWAGLQDGSIGNETAGADRVPASAGAGATGESSGSSRIPPVAFAVVLIALIAFGGYTAVKRQNSLQAEIRDLQSRLATQGDAADMSAAETRIEELLAENREMRAELIAERQGREDAERQQSALESELEALRAAAAPAPAATQEATPASAAATAAAPRTPSAAETASESGWFVNFGSFSDRAVAQRWADEITVDGGTLRMQRVQSNGRTLYRVRVTAITSESEARRIARELEQRFSQQNLWVGRSN